MKDQVANELKSQFAQGNLKPSQLKKSKSTGDLPTTNTPLTQPRRKSVDLLSQPASLKAQLTEAQDQISILELKLETCQRELAELNNLSAENTQLKKDLANKNTELNQTKQELDNSLAARHQALKVFQQEHSKRKQAQNELNNTVEESAEELTKSDQEKANLRTQLAKANQQIESLKRELKLATRNQLSLTYSSDFNQEYFKYLAYSLFFAVFIITLTRRDYD